MNILLTGGTGYIGSHVAVVLAGLGHDVVLLDNLSNSDIAVVQRIEDVSGRKLLFVRGDVCDTGLVRQVLRNHGIGAVVHLAGLKAVGESVDRPIDYYVNNVGGALSLVSAMRDESVKTLVFSSSATVYGAPKQLPIDESHPTSATSPYGRSKLYVEEMLSDVSHSDGGWRIACLRYFNPVGAHESGLIGEDPRGIPNNLMPYIAQVAFGKRPELNIFGDDYPTQDGTGVRDYLHVMDLAEGHAAALSFLQGNRGWHAFNLGTGRGYSVLEMVHAFEKVSGKNIPCRIAPRRSGDVAECYANPEKAKDMLNWTARRTLDDMCESLWRFQCSNGKGTH